MSTGEVGMEMKDDGDRLRITKLEEALEIQSLRRIISAYLNYPDATEKDVKRYERSYTKLPPSHKALLSHYPSKFQSLRRCISVNSFFIFNMLQAFEPPLDLSQGINTCDHSHLENANDHLFSGESNISSCPSASTSERMCVSKSDQACNGEGSYKMCKLSDNEEDMRSGDLCGPILRSCPTVTEYEKDTDKAGFHDLKRVNNQATPNSASITNKNVSSSTRDWLDASLQLEVPLVDVDKVRCTLRNIVRDWAIEGQKERDQCYKPILEELDSLFPNRQEESPPACLVPGAGLGRLAWEISCLGFVSQGNEFSYYMMICSSFILNDSQTAGEWTIYPWIHTNCNSLSDSDQLRPVSFPDIHPASCGGTTEGFSMCGGDFIEVYSDPSQVGFWDAVVTCFFIDTAHNIVEYVEIISTILKDGGVWINLGPLLYHFADMYGQEDEMSIEPSLEDVKKIAFNFGFQLEKEMTIETTFSANPHSMMQNRYYSAFWTMRKKPVTPTKKDATP